MSSVLYGYMVSESQSHQSQLISSSLFGITSRYSTDHDGLVDTDHYKAEVAPSLARTCS